MSQQDESNIPGSRADLGAGAGQAEQDALRQGAGRPGGDVGVDLSAHDEYWRENHAQQPYAKTGDEFERYRAAYRSGAAGAKTHGHELQGEQLDERLKGDYARVRDEKSVEWEHAQPAARAAYGRAAEEIRILLHEERLRVGKREVETGQVHVHKVVHTEQVSVPVELRREDVVIERVPADQVQAGARTGEAFTEQTLEVPLHAEEAVVQKETQVTGAVRVRKTEEVERQVVSDTVSKEDVEVVRDDATTRLRTADDATRTGRVADPDTKL